ncbi:MAG: iron chelate uptake ABC transporter family permease subunit [Cellvibrionales bacterium]|nr:iron chelate uptake ABC transporter family permease subunit [Cellvibrionales bacterium]
MKNVPFPLLFMLISALLILGIIVAVIIGPASISALEVLQALLNGISGGLLQGLVSDIALWQQTIIDQVRLPRVLTAVLVGASLAVCGAVLQGLFRNPLASPSVLGVSSGASLGAVVAIFLGLAASTLWVLPLFAFLGAAVTLLVVYQIATYRGHTPMGTLLLAGVAVGAFNVAMSSLILALSLQNWEVGRTIVYWTMGGLDGRGWHHVLLILPIFIVAFTVMMSFERDLDILLMGEIHANAVGVDVPKVRLILLLVTALLTGCAVSVAGGIGFVGLVVPHMIRLLVGPHHRKLLPLSAMAGALILVIADLMVRSGTSDTSIPLGVITASMGAPFFLFLLFKQRKLMRG